MTTPSPNLLAFLKRHEGVVLHPYCCQAGVWTIGYGHTRGVTETTPPITQAQAEALLVEDAAAAVRDALVLSPGLALEPTRRLDAVADFVFNFGAARYRKSTLLQRVNAKDWPAAAREMKRWVYVNVPGRGLEQAKGLVRRRGEAAAWLLED